VGLIYLWVDPYLHACEMCDKCSTDQLSMHNECSLAAVLGTMPQLETL
jgi:hypothetical protein